MSSLFSSSLQKHMGVGNNVMMSNTLQQGKDPHSASGYTRTHTYDKAKCSTTSLNLFEIDLFSAVEVRLPALFLPVHTPAQFATIELNFGCIARSP